ncbi:MAG: hypothetical protein IPM29_06770 [Planctomycetes bacterium]|nr:hypothetical protein [Planctomycetota bacterium]
MRTATVGSDFGSCRAETHGAAAASESRARRGIVDLSSHPTPMIDLCIRSAASAAISFTLLVPSGTAFAQRALEPARIVQSWAPPVTLERDDAGALIARGHDYAGRFRSGVVEFAAAGAEVGESATLEIGLGRIRRGDGTPLRDVPGGVEAVADGQFAVFDRGEGVRERFAVRADGLEWSVVFERRPKGSGDLVVEASLRTDLQPEPAADGALHFRDPDGGGVSIGTVTGVDAEGSSVEGRLRLDGRTLRLELPGSFVDAACYPLTLDPLVGSIVTTHNPGYGPSAIDCAYSPVQNNYLIAWARPGNPFFGQPAEVWTAKLDSTGIVAGTPLRLAQFNSGTPSPVVGVAYARQYDRFLVVFGHDNGLVCQSVDPGTPWRSSLVPLSTSRVLELSVGSDPEYDKIRIACLCEEASGRHAVYSTAVTVGLSAPTPWPINYLQAPSTPWNSYQHVAVSHDRGRALVVFTETWNSTSQYIHVQEVNDRGGLVRNPLLMLTGTNTPLGRISIDGDDYGGLVVWEETSSLNGSTDLYGRLVFADPGRQITFASALLPIATDPTYNEVEPSVAWFGSKYGVFWTRPASPNSIEGRELAPQCTPCGLPITISPTTSTALAVRSPHIVPHRRSGANSHDALLLFAQSGILSTDSGILSTRFSAFGPGGSIGSAGGQCGSARTVGTIGTDGPFAIGNRDFRVTLSGSTGNLAIALVGVPGLDIPCGACVITQPVLGEARSIVLGSASYVFPVPCLPTMLGSRLTFQWIVNHPALTTSCLQGWGATQQLHARLGY